MAEPAETFIYDRVPYETVVVPEMSPSRLRGAGILHGWLGPDPATASVLEIGCADGLNCLAFAAAAPGARICGFDLSAPAIERGRERARAAGLGDVDLRAGDILDFPLEGEPFDYIVAHGIYAWTPPAVRAHVMKLIGARLGPNGVAYVSYDVLPGALAKAELNRFLRGEIAQLDDPQAQVELTLNWLKLLSANQQEFSPLASTLKRLEVIIPMVPPLSLLHDLLAEHYAPESLLSVARAGAANGLVVAGDAGFRDLTAMGIDEAGRGLMGTSTTIVGRGSLIDWLRGDVIYRATMFRRAGAPPPAEPMEPLLRLASPAQREAVEGGQRYFADRTWLIARVPQQIAILDALVEAAPAELSLEDLRRAAGNPDTDTLMAFIRQGAALGLITVHASPMPFVTAPGARPALPRLSRAVIPELKSTLSLRHKMIGLDDELSRALLQLCDGTRTRARLLEDLVRHGHTLQPAALGAQLDKYARLGAFVA